MIWLYVLAAVVAGGAAAVQAGANAQLRVAVGSPVLTAMLSASITVVALFILALTVIRPSVPSRAALTGAPWWAWTGGLLGGAYLVGAVILAPRLGAGVLFALLIVGQLGFSLTLDHFGLVGFPRQALNPARVAGAVLLVAGAVVIQRA